MGKRKKSARKPTGPRKREPLATNFRCVFCNHETGVTVKMDRKTALGQLSCKSCGQHFQSGINALSAPVDVYANWVDACDLVANGNAKSGRSGGGARRGGDGGGGARARIEDDGEDGEEY